MTNVAVVMPAWNEAEGISGFIQELHAALSEWSPVFVIVDDCSVDNTAGVVKSLAKSAIPVEVLVNERNIGHGPSTVIALKRGVTLGVDYILAIDGDGQFLGEDVRLLLQRLETSGVDVTEGVRVNRDSPAYRRFVSLTTRLFVATRGRILPADANTPLRAYRADALRALLTVVPADVPTPNLVISALCRRWRFRLIEIPVRSIPRRGSNQQGTTWGNVRRDLPSRKFLGFTLRAAVAWVSAEVNWKQEISASDG